LAETTGTGTSAGFRMKGDSSADYTLFTTQGTNQFAIYDNANSAQRFTLNSDGNVGIGTANPLRILHVKSGAGTAQFESTTTSGTIYFADTGSTVIDNQGIGSRGNSIAISAGGLDRLTIDSTGAATFSSSVTATTFLGDLNGTINTVTTAVTKANSTNDTTVATTAFVQNLIGTIPAGLVFQGTWNAATNTPTLTSGTGTTGNFYIVSVAGTTSLDGITDWQVGDWAVFVEQGATDAWEKVDNSSVLDGSGTGQTVALWSGSGTSNTLTDAPITVSGNNTTFAGTINSGYITSTAGATFAGTVTTDGLFVNASATGNAKIVAADQAYARLAIDNLNGQEWNLIAGTAGASNSGFGIYDADAAATRLQITSAGNVGIGTTSPSHKLTVSRATEAAAYQININNDGGISNGNFTGIRFSQDAGGTTELGNIKLHYYSTGATDLSFGTRYDTQAIYIKNGGNVGIGTTSPGNKLHVVGSATVSTSILVPGASTANALMHRFGTGGGSGSYTTLDVIKTADTSGDFVFMAYAAGVAASTSSPKLIFGQYDATPSNGAVMTIDTSNERVGIGTTNPGQKLSVNGSIESLADGHGEGGQVILRSAPSGTRRWNIDNYGTSNELRLFTEADSDGSAGAVKVLITEAGNVGIGTTSPGAQLEVMSTTGGTLRLKRDDGSVTTDETLGTLEFYTNDGDGAHIASYVRGLGADLAGQNYGRFGALSFGVSMTANTDAVEAMRIDLSGNLGIGTDNPGRKLTVQGADDGTMQLRLMGTASQTSYWDIGREAASTGQFRFIASRNGTVITPMVIDDQTGNVGIGTTSPSGKLNVNVENAISTVTISRGGSDLTAGTALGNIVFPADYSGTPTNYASIDAYANALSGVRGSLDFKVKSTDGSLLTGMTVYGTNSGANVGIGTTAPSGKLQIGNGTSNSPSSVAILSADGGNAVLNALSLVNSRAAADGNGTSINFHNANNYGATGRITSIQDSGTNASLRFSVYNSTDDALVERITLT
jgi:hypothetical protein